VPELIKRKSEMSLEMAQLGTGQKNIDGSSVYKANSIDFDEEQFVLENYKSALLDLEYLMVNYNRSEEIFYVAKIHQILKEYNKSTEAFNRLLNDDEYKYEAIFNIADNYVAQNKLSEAEAQLNNILMDNPKAGIVYEKLSEIYNKTDESDKAKQYKKKAVYFNNIPSFLEMEYSEKNYELLVFFGSDESQANEKISKLNTIHKQSENDFTIDVCLMILKLHANHGNGVEERATEILGIIGKPAIEKVNELFQFDVSTCTVTNLADVMAKVKDENSWELMKQYLPYIANMPMTLIPPSLPEKMIQFNEDEGIREILKVIKPLLVKKEDGNDPMAELAGFGQYVYYSPLKKINKKKLKKISKELNYSDEEFKLLEEKIK
jgi:tetratricopeptide (TPR) repeat protein